MYVLHVATVPRRSLLVKSLENSFLFRPHSSVQSKRPTNAPAERISFRKALFLQRLPVYPTTESLRFSSLPMSAKMDVSNSIWLVQDSHVDQERHQELGKGMPPLLVQSEVGSDSATLSGHDRVGVFARLTKTRIQHVECHLVTFLGAGDGD